MTITSKAAVIFLTGILVIAPISKFISNEWLQLVFIAGGFALIATILELVERKKTRKRE